ncbi:FAD/NAD(P)-binding domain-containing protein [Aspergillus keveii]|uniref:FAD/NAD(P)-binding domain-containing protein n=1 Tax=Aspergillus keveii TaxID=714993 RepID=A0ABR4GIZ7_9EURO
MDTDRKTPYPPPQAHAAPGSSPAPAVYEYNLNGYDDSNSLELQQRPKRELRTWGDIRQEWKYGSKSRVFRYYILYVLIGRQEITADVCILGGGGTGSYAAAQFISRGYSVAVVEKEDHLGGHSHTLYVDGGHFEYGVGGYFNLEITRNFFDLVGVPYENFTAPAATYDFINFETGERVNPGHSLDPYTAASQYLAALRQFDYLWTGAYYLPDEVPEVLLRPFREFVEANSLRGVLQFVQTWTKAVGNLLETPLLYVIQGFSLSPIDGFLRVGGIVPKNGTRELFRMAARYIGERNTLYSSRLTAANRNSTGVELLVEGVRGLQTVVRAKQLLITFPPILANLDGFDLDGDERSVFSKLRHNSFYGGIVANTSIPDGVNLVNLNPSNQPGNLPLPPFLYALDYTGISGYHTTRITGDAHFTEADARRLLLGDLKRMEEVGTFPGANGFYKKLYALQGHRSTYYTGYTFCTDYSPQLWNYTLSIVDLMNPERRS